MTERERESKRGYACVCVCKREMEGSELNFIPSQKSEVASEEEELYFGRKFLAFVVSTEDF